MERSYKFRLYPTKEQAEQIQKTFGCCRFVWNYYLNMRGNTKMNYYECSKDMTRLKKELVWLQEVDSSALVSSIRDLDTGFKHFFRRMKKGDITRYPKFKTKKSNHQSYKSRTDSIRLYDNRIHLPKLGLVKCRTSRKLEGRILSATVSQEPTGKYFVAICCEEAEFIPSPHTGKSARVSIDSDYLSITSDGEEYRNKNYKLEEKNRRKIARLQRQLSRKTKGSMRREKARIKIARYWEHIANQKNDALHKFSTAIIRDYDTISIQNGVWGELQRQLKYKSEWYGKRLILLDDL